MSTDANALTIVLPIVVTGAILDVNGSPSITNVPENDYPVWDVGTTYDGGDRVILTSTHRIYESLQINNIGNSPTAIGSAFWIDAGPTNRWAVFDTSVSTQTVQAENITYKLIPGEAINSIGILNITEGTQINITMVSPSTGGSGIVYQRTVDLSSLPLTSDWYAWFYGQKSAPTQSIALDLPAFYDCEVTIEIFGTSNLAVGVVLIGSKKNFGLGLKYGARVGIQDYSRKETNTFGETVLVQRAFAKRANFNLLIRKSEVDSFQNTLSTIRAVPVLWIGSTDYEATTLFGFYKNFDILISYPEHSDCELEIEGLI